MHSEFEVMVRNAWLLTSQSLPEAIAAVTVAVRDFNFNTFSNILRKRPTLARIKYIQ